MGHSSTRALAGVACEACRVDEQECVLPLMKKLMEVMVGKDRN
jgi:hypothetical protein